MKELTFTELYQMLIKVNLELLIRMAPYLIGFLIFIIVCSIITWVYNYYDGKR